MSFHTPTLTGERSKVASRSQMNKRAVLTIALLIFLAIFWLGIGLLQVVVAVSGTDNSRIFILGLGLWNIVMAFLMVWATRDVWHRYQTTPRELGIFAIVGVILAVLGIVTGAWLMACIIPAYVLLGVLLMVNRDFYTESKPSRQKNQGAQDKGSPMAAGTVGIAMSTAPNEVPNGGMVATTHTREAEQKQKPNTGARRTWLILGGAMLGGGIVVMCVCISLWAWVRPQVTGVWVGSAVTPSAPRTASPTPSRIAQGAPTLIFNEPQTGTIVPVQRQVSQRLIATLDTDNIVDGSGKISPDGRHLAILLKKGARKTVMVDEQEQGDFDDIDSTSLYFSPDGQRVAYVARSGAKYALIVDGTPGKGYDKIAGESIAFSPDSQHLVYGAQDSTGSGILVFDGEERARHEGLGPIFFSPDSQHLAYAAMQHGIFGIGERWFVVRDGKQSEKYEGIGQMVFSPDSSRLAFQARTNGKWVVMVDDSSSVTYDGVGPLEFSPDSRHWTYRAQRGGKQFAVRDDQEGPLYDQIDNPHFSPDGKHIAYGARRGQEWFLVTDDRESKPYDEVFGQPPLFSPDSKHIVYSAKRGSDQFVVLDDQEGKSYRGVDLASIRFSPDSRILVYATVEDNKWGIVINGREDGFHRFASQPVFSPTGNYLAYVAGQEHEAFVVVNGVKGKTFPTILSESLHFDSDTHLHYLAADGTDVFLVEENVIP